MQAVVPLDGGQLLCPLILGKGGCPMVTYEALFAYTMIIIGIITLVYEIMKKK